MAGSRDSGSTSSNASLSRADRRHSISTICAASVSVWGISWRALMTSSDDTEFDPKIEATLRARVGQYLVGSLEGRGVRVGLACSRFNGGVTTRLLEGALTALAEHGVDRSDVTIAWAPGAFELPLVARGFA